MITCLMYDIDEKVSYYIPRKNISIDEFTNVHNKFKTDRQPSTCT